MRVADFDVKRRRHLEKLAAAREAGHVDERVLPVLDLLNAHPDLVTTSSCAGRVQVLGLGHPGDKAGSRVLGRWHEPVDDHFPVAEAAARAEPGALVVLFAEPPILHVEARDLDAAIRLRDLAEGAGFKRAALRTVSASTILVEVAGTDRLEAPIADGHHRVPDDDLVWLADHACSTWARGRAKLERFELAAREFK